MLVATKYYIQSNSKITNNNYTIRLNINDSLLKWHELIHTLLIWSLVLILTTLIVHHQVQHSLYFDTYCSSTNPTIPLCRTKVRYLDSSSTRTKIRQDNFDCRTRVLKCLMSSDDPLRAWNLFVCLFSTCLMMFSYVWM